MGARGRKLDEDKLTELQTFLTANTAEAEQVAAHLSTNTRNVYRWLKVLESRGANIVRLGTGGRGKFRIFESNVA